ncbi:impact family protein [Cordyceps fumosorosea ARSEF 2679]|uniref:Impact family protein n=1 Tax=Cordyceps fumosorosea (strain ARSEF 2679) TaxID=1081104 RepID=A0A168D7K6_CORFA|nr:impact family protein [Cordyceps fumosorosea ARSEF 2679]OAA72260.1 impact family protein [Cordyceps fumosorosea ARSEF 2679]
MSDELRDEVEAINSIYGDGSLVPAVAGEAADYVLQLPGEGASSLQLRFPAGYPESSDVPFVIGVQRSAGGVRDGNGARDLRLFRAALAEAYQPGAVCLFDAVEEYSRLLAEEEEEAAAAAEEEDDADDREGMANSSRADDDAFDGVDLASLPPPPWTVSEPVVDAKSTFVAHVAAVASPAQARLYVAQLLAGDRRIRDATHNISAWRIRGAEGAATGYQDCDDDGEDAAGGRLLRLMQLMGLWDAMVVVTRWYGGVKLGPRRFAIINGVARDAFVKAGMVPESGGVGKGKKKS